MKRAGLCAVVFAGKTYSSTWWNHTSFRAFRITIWMVCLIRYFWSDFDGYLGFFESLNVGPIVLAGNILLTVGFALTVVVHLHMGCRWRSGIDPVGPNQLITDGYYRFSRNPMFLSIATAQFGFFFVIPSVFSSVCLIFGLYTLHRQTLAEEAHLLKSYPEDYGHYMGRVRRWI